MSVLNLISNSGYICVNKGLIKQLGLNCAILLGELASLYQMYEQTEKLDPEGMFYLTGETCNEDTGLSYYEQSQALNKLSELNLISCKVKGIPAKRYIKFNEDEIEKFIRVGFKNLNTTNKKIETLDSKNLNTTIKEIESNKNIINNNILNNNLENNIVYDKSYTTNLDNILTNSTSTTPEFYKQNEDIELKTRKPRNPENSKKPEVVVKFIKSLQYNQDTIDLLIKWYYNVAIGKLSINMLKDKITRLYESVKTEEEAYESFKNSYINNWMAFYPPKSYSKSSNYMYENQRVVSESDYARNEDGTVKEY